MKAIKLGLILLLSIGTLVAAIGATRSLRRGDDDYAIVNQLANDEATKRLLSYSTPERKSALWRKHYRTELDKHPELTEDQKAVVDLATVMASTDMFRENLPEPCGPGSVFRTAGENAFKDAPELRREIFGQPGEPLPKFAHANTQEYQPPDCECNLQSWCNSCSCFSLCSHRGCMSQAGGCGCFWQSGCDTMCQSCF